MNITTVPSDKLKEMQQTIAEQAAVIEKLGEVVVSMSSETSSHYDRIEISRKALATTTNSKQVLQEWLDKILGTAAYWTDDNGTFCFGYSSTTPIALFKKPEIK